MISRYKQLDLDDATAGMVLSEAVLDAHGAVLFPSATSLTDAMLTSLQRRGITTVFVVNDDLSEADVKTERKRVQQRLTVLFRRSGSNPACQALMQRIIEYRIGTTE